MQDLDRSAHQLRVKRIARDLIAQKGAHAVHAAIERLNEAIDRQNWPARSFWAEVVHEVLEQQRAGKKVD
jgi:hypothetical protein